MVQVFHQTIEAFVELVLQQVPVEAAVVVPLARLSQLGTHEVKLGARMGVHIAEEQTEIGELLPLIAGHLVDQTALAMHHLVVRKGQHEVLLKGIHDAEGDFVVVERPEQRVFLEIS